MCSTILFLLDTRYLFFFDLPLGKAVFFFFFFFFSSKSVGLVKLAIKDSLHFPE